MLLLPLLCMLLLTACVQEIPAPPAAQNQVAVSCVLTNSDVQKLKLTYSMPAHTGLLFEEVKEATATLFEEDKPVGTFAKVGYGRWELNFRPTEGKQYRLRVEVAGYPEMTSTTTMPEKPNIKRGEILDEGHTRVFNQLSQSNTLWMFCLKLETNDLYYLSHPEGVEDSLTRLTQEIATDHKNADQFNQEGSSSEYDKKYGNLPSYKYYVRIPMENGIKNNTPYRFRVQPYPHEATYVVFRAASVEYDRYLKSVMEKMFFYEAEDDPAQWFDENTIYSNIENGLGIFGAYSKISFYNRIIQTNPL